MAKRKKKPTPSDILSWLSHCVSEVDADGYQQTESSEERWRVFGPPELSEMTETQAFATLEGETFLLKVRRLPKPRGEIRTQSPGA